MAQSTQQLITSLLEKNLKTKSEIIRDVVKELKKYDKDATAFGDTIVFQGHGYKVKLTVNG